MSTIRVNLGHGLVEVEDGGDVDLDVEVFYRANGSRLAEDAARDCAAEITEHMDERARAETTTR